VQPQFNPDTFYSGQNSLNFSAIFYRNGCISSYTYSKQKAPTCPPLLLTIHWSLYFQVFQSVVLRFQKHAAIQAVQGVIFSVWHPCHGILFLHSCPVLSMIPQLRDITMIRTSSQRLGKGQKGKSAMGDPQFDFAAKGFQLQPGS